jgi:hypothetical protein
MSWTETGDLPRNVSSVKIVSWNCRRGGEHDRHLDELAPDVAVLPEWGWLPMRAPASASAFVEFGETGKLGLAVAAFGPWSVAKAHVEPISGTVIGAVDISGPTPFHLIAVWSYLSGGPKLNPVIEALDTWASWIGDGPLVVAGDFNTGGGWKDILKGPMSHFPIVKRLESLGLHSAYHVDRSTEQGTGEETTLWHSRGGEFMVDHVFTPTNWPKPVVTIGPADPWRTRSDHAPVSVDIGLPDP